jgi:hypothetical protein
VHSLWRGHQEAYKALGPCDAQTVTSHRFGGDRSRPGGDGAIVHEDVDLGVKLGDEQRPGVIESSL